MDPKPKVCPVCEGEEDLSLDRRDFLKTAAAGVAAGAAGGLILPGALPTAEAALTPQSAAEQAVVALYQTLTDRQKQAVCFGWDYTETAGRSPRGLLRTHVSNNWQITPHHITSDFYTQRQRGIIFDIFRAVYNPEWHTRILRQLHDDTGGHPWGTDQSIAIFGTPGQGRFQFVMTGRHQTVRADGGSTRHMAFGGPIFYGHAASGFNERTGHPGNVFWDQARRANMVYRMLSGRQQQQALLERRPRESAVGFRRPDQRPGIPVSELSRDQRDELNRVLGCLLEPFRTEDRDEARACLQRQGGLEHCNLAFYREGDIGEDQEWDNWRLEGPAFVWYFRGEPHVHVWVNVGDDPSIPLNARG